MDFAERPLVSIIMPVYNAQPYVETAISSVVCQTIKDWELFVIDDGSTDNSVLTAKIAAGCDPRIRILSNPENIGVSSTRNRGIEMSKGKYIAFLDSDDVWYPEKLKKQLDEMEAQNAQMSYCSYAIIDAFGKRIRADYLVPKMVTFQSQLKENSIQLSSLLICTDALKDIRFNTSFYHEDYILGLELLRSGCKAVGCTEVLSEWRYIETSRSFNKLKAAKNRWKIYRQFLHLPLWKSVYVFVHYAFSGLRKYTRKLKD